jgi:glycosyltransferase involved in cell wall biosynthesis
MDPSALSLCMIVKNEERNLSRCLDSVAGLASEIIVVDTGSTDATPGIALSYGAILTTFDFTFVDFAAARNLALSLAAGRWILALDADEFLDPQSVPLIRERIAANLTCDGRNVGYYFQRLNRQPDSQPPTRDYVVRLFPNRPANRYRGRVHETIDHAILSGGGQLVPTGIRIHHEFATDRAARRRRNLWYIGILNEEIAADPEDCSRLSFLAAEYHQLGMFDQAAEIADRIARLRPLDPEAHLHAGIYYLLYKPDRERARAAFTTALNLRPGYSEAIESLRLMAEDPGATGIAG